MATHSEYEGFVFSNRSMTTEQELRSDLQQQFPAANPSFFDDLFNLYPARDYNSTFYRRQDLFGDFIIDCPTRWMMEAMNSQNQATYKLICNAGTQKHGADSTFVYDDNYECKLDPSIQISLANSSRSLGGSKHNTRKVHERLVHQLHD